MVLRNDQLQQRFALKTGDKYRYNKIIIYKLIKNINY